MRELLKDPMFDKALSEAELSAWQSPEVRSYKISLETTSVEYKKEIEQLSKCFCQLGDECQSNCTFCGCTWTIF